MLKKIIEKKYYNIPINIDELMKESNESPNKKQYFIKTTYAAISYAENILGYPICSQHHKILFIKTNKQITVNATKYTKTKIINIKSQYNPPKHSASKAKLHHEQNNIILFDKNVYQCTIQAYNIVNHVDEFLLYILKLHIKLLTNPLSNQHISIDYINKLYQPYIQLHSH